MILLGLLPRRGLNDMTFHTFLNLYPTHIPQQELVYLMPEHGTGRGQGVRWILANFSVSEHQEGDETTEKQGINNVRFQGCLISKR